MRMWSPAAWAKAWRDVSSSALLGTPRWAKREWRICRPMEWAVDVYFFRRGVAERMVEG
jgi:hypothetical protein